jgi:hypothetical protein
MITGMREGRDKWLYKTLRSVLFPLCGVHVCASFVRMFWLVGLSLVSEQFPKDGQGGPKHLAIYVILILF